MRPRDLAPVPLFADLPADERAQVAHCAEWVEFDPGTTILHEGRFSYRFFAVAEGVVGVFHDQAQVATLGPGDFFGEIGVMPHGSFKWGRRTATVVAATRVRAIAISGHDLRRLLQESPGLAE